jgi:hypothetical protein
MSVVVDAPAALRLPDFLIIGEMRCGSTTLWELLSRHEKVFFSSEKELHFFDNREGRFDRGIASYAQWFVDARGDQICGEATPDYLFHDEACARIHETVPQAKLLVILRDPVERAWSHYWHNVRRGREELSFEQALKSEPQRMARGDAELRSHCSYASRGRYIEQLRRYEAAFGKEQLCVIFLDELKRNARDAMQRVCDHLGLETTAAFDDPVVPERNKAHYPRWPRANGAGRKVKHWLSACAPLLEPPLSAVARMTRPLRAYCGAPRMHAAMKASLKAQFAQSDAALAQWLGRAVPWTKSA